VDKHNIKGGLWNLLISLLALSGSVLLVISTGASTAFAVLFFIVGGLMIAAVSWVHMLLANREQLERVELEEVSRGRAGEALFSEGGVLPAKRSLEQFEKWGVPVVAVIIFLIQAGGVFYLGFNKLPALFEAIEVDKNVIFMHRGVQYQALVITALVGMILFIRGQFSSNYSRIEKQRLLQPASDYVLFGAYLNFVVAAMVAVSFKDQRVDAYVGSALAFLLAFMALENLLSMIFEIYRPRMANRRARLLYQSRLVGLIAKPENLFTTVGKVLNYQFGFKVSETWGYRFLRERLGVLIGIQIILYWLSTSIVVIQPSEVGRLVNVLGGAAKAKTLKPGFHLKMPWPFASVDRYYPGQAHSFIVGLQPTVVRDMEGKPVDGLEMLGMPKLWAAPVGKDYDALRKSGQLYFMSGGSNTGAASQTPNILVASVPVHYKIQEDQLEEKWLKYINPEQLLKNIAYREISAFFLGSNLEKLLKTQGSDANNKVMGAIQAKVNDLGLGVTILFVGLGDIRPPAESPSDIKGTASQGEEKQGSGSGLSSTTMAQAVESRFANIVRATADLDSARGFQERQAILAASGREQEKGAAKVEVDLAEVRAKGDTKRMEGESGSYHAAPEVYRQWRYLESFRKAVANARKFVIAVGKGVDVQVDLDLQESLRREFYDVPADGQ
jgi:regulator of protease activity HflC (stomatin/prohibitin superfamily)